MSPQDLGRLQKAAQASGALEGAGLSVEGDSCFVPLPSSTTTARAEGGHEVVLDAGMPTVGAENALSFRVRSDGGDGEEDLKQVRIATLTLDVGS